MKFLAAVFLCAGVAGAAIWPEKIGDFERGAVSTPAIADRPVWDELGLKNSESAVYTSGKKKFTATGWQLQDTTGGLAAYEWQRPAGAKSSGVEKYAAE